jgi:hypothetical protein
LERGGKSALRGGKVVQRQVLYLGEINDTQRESWCRTIEVFITPEGFPPAYEVLPGNTSDKTTLHKFLRKIEEQYGKAERVWPMDWGDIPTEEVRRAQAFRRFTTWWDRLLNNCKRGTQSVSAKSWPRQAHSIGI